MRFSWKVVGCIGILVGFVLAGGVYLTRGLSTEERDVVTLCEYREEYASSYWARLRPNVLYGEVIGEGDTIYIRLAEEVEVHLVYGFNCSLEGDVSLDYRVTTTLCEPSQYGWTREADAAIYNVTSEDGVDPSSASIGLDVWYNVSEVREVIQDIEEDTGYRSSSYSVVTEIRGNLTDETSAGVIDRRIEAVLALNLDYAGGVVKVEAPDRVYGDRITEDHTERLEANINLRRGTLASLLAWLAVAPALTLWRYNEDREHTLDLSESERILRDHDVIESDDLPEGKTQTLATFEGLKDIAEDYGLRLFHKREEDGSIFFATDYTLTYRYVTNTEEDN